jgi:uncharacterized membrane protein YdjX (TVP38/TMEM64 family)
MTEQPNAAAGRLRRIAPLAALAAAAGAAAWFGGDLLSFETLERNRDALRAWASGNLALAAVSFAALYAAAVAVSAPGAVWLTITGGFVFGLWLGGALSVIGATIGATVIFAAVRAGFGERLRARASGWLARLSEGFRRNEAEYMLALRLTPIAPFFIVNVAPAFLGVRPWTYVWTTFLGIIPGGLVYASIGAGLDAIIARGERPDLGVIFTLPVLGPLLALAALSLTPVLWRALRKGHTT